MCGIAGVYLSTPYENGRQLGLQILEVYKNQSSRGNQGFGVVVIPKDGEVKRLRTLSEKIFSIRYADIWDYANKPDTIVLFHNRMPTSTLNRIESNHPIANEDQSVFMVHNGVVRDHHKHYKELKKLGHEFETKYYGTEEVEIKDKKMEKDYRAQGYTICSRKREDSKEFYEYVDKKVYWVNDSEVIVHKLEQHNFDHKLVLKDLEGQFAVAYWHKGDNHQIDLFKKGNPISLFDDKLGNHWFASVLPSYDKGFVSNTFHIADGHDAFIDATGFHNGRQLVEYSYNYNYAGCGTYDNPRVYNGQTGFFKNGNYYDSCDYCENQRYLRRFQITLGEYVHICDDCYLNLREMDEHQRASAFLDIEAIRNKNTTPAVDIETIVDSIEYNELVEKIREELNSGGKVFDTCPLCKRANLRLKQVEHQGVHFVGCKSCRRELEDAFVACQGDDGALDTVETPPLDYSSERM